MRVQITSGAVFADLPDGGVVVHTATKRYYSLNETGARIWALLEETGDPSVVAAKLASLYDISGEEATRAVDELTDGLVTAGLVSKVEAG